MKHTLLILISLMIFVGWSCNDEETDQSDLSSDEQTEEQQETLSIAGNDIWVRSAPTTGKVIMKLNEGDRCVVLEKGKQETINRQTDFWYKIEFEGETGWVFGSQTSLSTGVVSKEDSKQTKEMILSDISKQIDKIHKEYKNIDRFFYDSQGVLFINNPGVYVVVEFTDDLSIMEPLFVLKVACKPEFSAWPEFDYDSYGWKRSGCFVEQLKGSKHFLEAAEMMQDNMLPVPPGLKSKAQTLGSAIELQVLNTYSNVRYFFGRKDGQWRLIGLDISDFSA